MTDSFVQQNAGPAGAEHHIHLAGRGRNRVEVHQRLSIGFVDLGLPCVGFDIGCITRAAASAVAAGFHAIAVGADDRYINPDQRTDIAPTVAIGADNLHRLPLAGNRRRELHHPRIERAGIGVHVFQKFDLLRKFELTERVRVRIQRRVCSLRRDVDGAFMSGAHRADCFGSTFYGRF